MNKLVVLFAALLCAGMLCACGDSTQGDVLADTTVVDGSGIAETTAEVDAPETTICAYHDTTVVEEADLTTLDSNANDNVTSNDTTNPILIPDDTNIEQLVITPAIVTDSPVDLNDYDLIDIFQNKIYFNYIAWNAVNDGIALVLDFNDEYHDEHAATEYYRVQNIQDYDAFCELTDAVFSHALQENTIFPKYLNLICPLFISYKDRLYYNYNTGGCISFIIDFSTAEIIDKTDESFNVSVDVSTHDTEEKFIYHIVNQDGHWVMDNDYWYK